MSSSAQQNPNKIESSPTKRLSTIESLPAEILVEIYKHCHEPNFVYASRYIHGPVTEDKGAQEQLVHDVCSLVCARPRIVPSMIAGVSTSDHSSERNDYEHITDGALTNFWNLAHENWLAFGDLTSAAFMWMRAVLKFHLNLQFAKIERLNVREVICNPRSGYLPPGYFDRKRRIWMEAFQLIDRLESNPALFTRSIDQIALGQRASHVFMRAVIWPPFASRPYNRRIHFEVSWPPALVLWNCASHSGWEQEVFRSEFLCPAAAAMVPDPESWCRRPEKLVAPGDAVEQGMLAEFFEGLAL